MPIEISADVREALASGRGVVALESAVITHGLPEEAALEALRRQWDACLAEATVPAVVAVYQGSLRVGLSLDECAALARRAQAAKVSPWNLVSSMITPGFGGTTVAATIVAAAMAGIRILSTGGIGGVHPGDGRDVSSDLTELSRRPVCVVCAGPKSTLDRAATLERLETLAVPVIGWRSDRLAGFLAESADLRLPARIDSEPELVSLLRAHWELGGQGVVVSQPLAGEAAIPAELVDVDDGGGERGPDRTPAELGRLRQRLGPQMVRANVALLEQNARLGARLAAGLAMP